VALDPSLGQARTALGHTLLYGRKHHQALAQILRKGLKSESERRRRSCPIGEVYVWMGQPEEAIQRIKQAMRLNPYHPNWYFLILAGAQFFFCSTRL